MRKTRAILLLCLLSVFTLAGTACKPGPPGYLTFAYYGFNQPLTCDEGTFCLKDIFLTEEIKAEEQNYRSETIYLIVRIELDFHNFSLQECGVTIYNYVTESNEVRYYPIRGSEDLDLSLTQALSPDLHLDGQPGPVQGTAWLCFHVPAEIQDYLYEQAEKEAGEMTWEEQFNFGLYLDLNDVYYQAPLTTTQIGCRLDQIEIYETYPIEA